MRLALTCQPATPCPAVARIDVEAARTGPGALALSYVLTGAIGALAIPGLVTSARADELWKHTCFEAFVRAGDGEAYLELNLSPSTEWAAYQFDAYRAGMGAAPIAAPRVEVAENADRLRLTATLDLATVLPPELHWRLALTAVVVDAAGAKSYWSLAHPAGRPDFHRAAGFVAELAAP